MSSYIPSQNFPNRSVPYPPPRTYAVNPFPSPDPNKMQSSPSYQIAQIEEQLQKHELETKKTNDVLNDKIRELMKRESSLMEELDIKTNENNNLKLNIDRLCEECDYNKSRANQIENDYNQMMFTLSNIQIENEQNKEDLQRLNEFLNKSKQKNEQLLIELANKENEVASLNSLLDKYSTDLRTIENKFNFTKREKESIYDMMSQEKDYNEKNKSELSQVKDENIKHKREREKLNEELTALKNDYMNSQNENKNLRQMRSQQDQNLNKIQMENEQLKEENKRLSEDLKSFQGKRDNIENMEQSFSNEVSKLKNEIASLISVCSENVNAFNYFLENYFGNLYSPNVQIPDININGTWNNNIRFDLLKKNLMAMKSKFDSDCSKYLSQIKDLKNALTKGQDDNFKYQKFIEDLYHLLANEIEDGKYFKPKTNQFQVNKNFQENIEQLLKEFFGEARKLKENQDPDYINKIMETNNELKTELELNQTKNEEIAADAYNLEKKVKYLLQEIELKNAHIKSMEEMISRRNAIEEDNKKLVKDNVMLINKIKKYQKTGNIEALYSNEELRDRSNRISQRNQSINDSEIENKKDQY